MALTVLEKLKLTKQLRDLNTEAAGLGAGAASAVKKLKIAKAMLELRAQLGLGAAKPEEKPAVSLAAAVIANADAMKGRVSSEMPMDVPDSWIVLNAPRPLLGHSILEGGPFLSGRFYAAINPTEPTAAVFLEENRKLDACVVVFATKQQQIEMALIGNEYAEQYRAEYQGDELYEVLHPQDRLNDKTAGELKALLAQVNSAPMPEPEPKPNPDGDDGVPPVEGAYKSIEDFEADYEKMGEAATAAMVFAGMGRSFKSQQMSAEQMIGAITEDRRDKLRLDPYSTKYANQYGDIRLAGYHMEQDARKLKVKNALSKIRGPWAAKLFDFYQPGGELAKYPHLVEEKFAQFIDLSKGYKANGANLAEQKPVEENANVALLRQIAAGGMDGSGEPLDVLTTLYGRIAEAVSALNDADLLTGDAEDAANAAITHWAELEEKLNG